MFETTSLPMKWLEISSRQICTLLVKRIFVAIESQDLVVLNLQVPISASLLNVLPFICGLTTAVIATNALMRLANTDNSEPDASHYVH